MPPPAEHPTAPRAGQLPVRQLPLDQCPVTVYREHDASKRQPSGPPRGLRQKTTGRAAPHPTPPPCRHPPPDATLQCPPRRQGTAASEKPASRPPAKPASASPVPLARPRHKNPERRRTGVGGQRPVRVHVGAQHAGQDE